MRLHRPLSIVALVLCTATATSPLAAADWLTAPSYFSHDWSSGERVAQYSPIGPFYYYCRPDYLKSGYRHYRSTIDLGNSSDNLHVVEQWGAPVVPYEQWRFPYRPYSQPYPTWGPPYGGLGGSNFNAYPFFGFPGAYGGAGGPYPYSGGAGPYPYSGGAGPYPYSGGAGPYPYSGGPAGAAAYGGPGGYGPGPSGGYGGYGGGPGFFFQPPANYAQPWLDGHYPSYDFNDRSQYWRPYTSPGLGH
jgi:hypothetical protein